MVFFIHARAVAKVPGVADIYRVVVEDWRDAIMAFAPQLLTLLTASLCTYTRRKRACLRGREMGMHGIREMPGV